MTLRKDAIPLKTAIDWSDKVAADPLGISANFVAYIRNAKALNIEASCGLVTKPSIFTAKTEEYAMARRLYLYSKGQPKTPLARELLAFALSPAVQKVLKTSGFVDQGIYVLFKVGRRHQGAEAFGHVRPVWLDVAVVEGRHGVPA